jgi:hypothetical protein
LMFLGHNINFMKIFSYIIYALALITIAVNLFKVDFSRPFYGNSSVAIIGIVAALCSVIIVTLYSVSKKIDERTK